MRQRVEALDVIRGYALFGILVCNIVLFNYPVEYISQYFSQDLNWFDQLSTYIRFNFFGDKTFSIFSLLFGIGIGMQYQKDAARFAQNHSIRMVLLLIIGCIHASVIWYGDILSLYAILGLILLLIIKLPSRTLIILACIVFVWPTIQTILMRNGLLRFGFKGSELLSLDELIELNSSAGIAGHLKYNFSQIAPTIQFYLSGTLYHSLSMIMLGAALGKGTIPFKISEQLKAYYQTLYITGAIVIIWNLHQLFFFDTSKMGDPVRFYVYWTLFNLSLVGQTLFSVAAIVLFLQKGPKAFKKIRVLRFLGRMSLTNYLLHSIIGLAIFKILNFYGQSSPGIDLGLAVAITVFQLVLSKIWLDKYGMGPIEKLWRTASKKITIFIFGR